MLLKGIEDIGRERSVSRPSETLLGQFALKVPTSDSGTSFVQKQGQTQPFSPFITPKAEEKKVLYNYETYYDEAGSVFSGQTEYIYSSVDDAKSAGMTATTGSDIKLIIVRGDDGKVYGSFKTSTGETTKPAGKEPSQKQGEGGAAEAGKGSGQKPDMGFRFRLRGWQWVWDAQEGHPETWKGHGNYYDIETSPYNYGSADDALRAGKAIGEENKSVIDVYSESNYPNQFAGKYYAFPGRDADAKNAVTAEKQAALDEYMKTHHYDPTKGGWVEDQPMPWEKGEEQPPAQPGPSPSPFDFLTLKSFAGVPNYVWVVLGGAGAATVGYAATRKR